MTRQGEDILEALDAWAIAFLRQQRLVWSGWRGDQRSHEDSQAISLTTDWSLRTVSVSDPSCLRLFLLSLLWRTTATKRSEFGEICLPGDDLETLRTALLSGKAPDLSFYPVTLIQLSTRGEIHNMSPICATKPVPPAGDLPSRKIPFFRFYFDGLIAHIHRQNPDEHVHEFGESVVGAGAKVKVATVPYERSFEKENLGHIIRESHGWPRAR